MLALEKSTNTEVRYVYVTKFGRGQAKKSKIKKNRVGRYNMATVGWRTVLLIKKENYFTSVLKYKYSTIMELPCTVPCCLQSI